MAYIGNTPALKYASFAVQHFTTSATTSYSLDNAVTNENGIALFINNVRQQPGGSYAYTAAGTTLTLSAATTTSDTMYCVFIGKAVQTVNPPAASVDTAQLATDAVTTAKILDDNVTLAKLDDGTQGDILYYGASGAPARLGFGTSGDFLKTQGTGANPVWASAGGGKIGQVISSGTSPTEVVIGSATFVALTDGSTALDASITPSATSSSVLMQVVIQSRIAYTRGYGVSLRRAGVEFYASATSYDIFNNNSNDNYSRNSWYALDTGISTTSATEYTVFVKTDGGGDVKFQSADDSSKIILWEILA